MRRGPRGGARAAGTAAAFRRLAGLSLMAGVLSACAGLQASATTELAPGAVVAMRPGDSARLPDRSRLAYAGLRSDSRCPPHVTCVHAGWVELDFTLEGAAGTPRMLVLSTRPGAAPVPAGEWRLELIEVGRGASPVAHVRASASGD